MGLFLFGGTRAIIAVAFFQNKLIDNILDHQDQTVDPEDIDDDIVFVLKSETKQRPSDKDDILHVVEEEDTRSVELFEYLLHYASFVALKFSVPSARWLSPLRIASCSAS